MSYRNGLKHQSQEYIFYLKVASVIQSHIAYVSENVAHRLTSHDRNKEFWNEAIIFTSKDENLTKAHIKHLESTLVNLSKLAGRYQLENGNTLTESSLPRADRDAMEEFVVNVRMVLGILGYPILEPILQTKKIQDGNITTQDVRVVSSPLSDLTFTVNNLTAKGAVTYEGFVLKKGSQFSKTNTDSISGKLIKLKERLLQEGALKEENNMLIATQDILMSSPSYAVAIVAGTSRSGPQNGKTMKKIEGEALTNS